MTTLHLDTGLCTKEEFESRLAAELERATEEGSPYAVLALVPQHLPGEGVADVVQAVADCLRSFLRDDDLVGRLDDEILAVGLSEIDPTEARVLAHRLQSDLGVRSFRLRNTMWEAGVACPPEDGTTAEELLQAAIEAARTRRRRLGL